MPRLKIATLAIALIALASPAHAETLNLVCEGDRGGSIELLVDLDRKTVAQQPASSCTWNIDGRTLVVPDCYPPGRAQISERSISWETTEKIVSGTGVVRSREVTGSLNRVTGAVYMVVGGFNGFEGKCRRATRKF